MAEQPKKRAQILLAGGSSAAGRADDAFYFDPEFTSKTPQGIVKDKNVTILI